LFVKVIPPGRLPLLLSVGTGYPLAETVNEPAVPLVRRVVLALVNKGGWPTVRVNVWDAAVPTPLEAVMTIG
jgi:hypothetical protein